MQLCFLEIFSGYRLFPTQSCEPRVEWLQRFQQGIDLAKLAALCRIFTVKNPECPFLPLHGLLGNDVDEIESPIAAELVTTLVGLAKVIAGLEEKYRNLRHVLLEQMENDEVFGLETAGEARFLL